MSIVLENPETGETRIIEPDKNGQYPGFRLPWRAVGTVANIEQAKVRAQRIETTERRFERMANFFGLSVAQFIEVAAKALNIPPCAACQLRGQVLIYIGRIGFWASMKMIAKSIAYQWRDDDEKLKQLANDLNAGTAGPKVHGITK
jgi:hypothetical protein